MLEYPHVDESIESAHAFYGRIEDFSLIYANGTEICASCGHWFLGHDEVGMVLSDTESDKPYHPDHAPDQNLRKRLENAFLREMREAEKHQKAIKATGYIFNGKDFTESYN